MEETSDALQKDQSPIDLAVSTLQKSVNNLGEKVDKLQSRLIPILRPTEPSDKASKAAEEPIASKHLDELNLLVYQINRINSTVSDISNRLEI